MTVREIAERHGQDVAAGNMRGALADFTPEALQAFSALGIMPPRGTNSAEVLSERQDGANYIYDVSYSNGADATTIRSTWAQQGDTWKIVKAEGV